MKLTCVSITGADDEVSIEDLNALARDYPFVEWAILYMPARAGTIRFPSEQWIADFAANATGNKALHLCGGGLLGFAGNKPDALAAMKGFRRIQLNLEFHNAGAKCDQKKLLAQIAAHPEHDFIIQYTDKYRHLLPALEKIPNHALLFDASAGRGVAPEAWPAPIPGHSCGYAGGLNLDNILINIEKISVAAGDYNTWIDMESGVRTNDHFDLKKVRRVLDLAAPFTA